MKNKGFTLMELLAVIIILSLIALIAVPVVSDLVSNSKISASKDSGLAVLRAAKVYYGNEEITGSFSGAKFKCDGTSCKKCTNTDCTTTDTNTILEFDGVVPTSGVIEITDEGNAYITEVLYYADNKAYVGYDIDGKVEAKKVSNELNIYGKSYVVGDLLTVGGTQWRVIEDSGINTLTVKLLKADPIDKSNYAFDSTSPYTSTYSDATIKNTVDSYINGLNLGTSLVEARLINEAELTALGCSKSDNTCAAAPSWARAYNYWTMIPEGSSLAYVVGSDSTFDSNGVDVAIYYKVIPVIVVSKTNTEKLEVEEEEVIKKLY